MDSAAKTVRLANKLMVKLALMSDSDYKLFWFMLDSMREAEEMSRQHLAQKANVERFAELERQLDAKPAPSIALKNGTTINLADLKNFGDEE